MRRTLLEVADEIRAIATTGLHYSDGEHDRERYQRLLGLAARVAATATDEPVERLEEIYRQSDHGYATPKLDVRLAIFRGDRVLLVHERSDDQWCLPGGYIDIGDAPSEAAVRETREEASVDARVTGLVGVFDNRLRPDSPPHLFQIYKLVFLGELIDPAQRPGPGSETRAAEFHPLSSLPPLSLGRTLPFHLDTALRVALGERGPWYD